MIRRLLDWLRRRRAQHPRARLALIESEMQSRAERLDGLPYSWAEQSAKRYRAGAAQVGAIRRELDR